MGFNCKVTWRWVRRTIVAESGASTVIVHAMRAPEKFLG